VVVFDSDHFSSDHLTGAHFGAFERFFKQFGKRFRHSIFLETQRTRSATLAIHHQGLGAGAKDGAMELMVARKPAG
jgi:hypothetical protein